MRKSATAGSGEAISGQPGAASWKSTTAESISAMVTTAVPAALIGAVVPIWGIGMITIGTPARARAILASVIGPSWAKGAMVQLMLEKTGRSATGAPATAANISSSGATYSGPRTSSCTCLAQERKEMASISRLAVTGSRSRAEMVGHT